ncbi:hypothetical protein [Peribacillus frigoritolerans]|uniref:Transposase n=1 Tax=Peribacillus castrilensis TaxID=2897690 RepID=A0AAW9NL96_9BACI|nr:hypothetical protein [Peribacillus castrilensis]
MKNFATLLQEKKLGSRDTKTLALMRLGRQLAEWERVSEKLERFLIKKRSSFSLNLSTV